MARSSLAKNTVMLYLLTASNYIFGFISIPYLTRVLGAGVYGVVGFATAFSVYVQLVLDFGFILSATARVSDHSTDKSELSRIYTAVSICKLVLIAASALVVLALLLFVDAFSGEWLLFALFFAYVSINSLVPDYIYRGIEQMSAVTVRSVIIKAVFLAGILAFVKTPDDYILIPLFYLIGATVAVVAVFVHMKNVLDISFCKVSRAYVKAVFRESVSYFASRIASTFYTSLNMIVLGFVMPGSVDAGRYAACNNAIQAGRALATPVADSMFPYMLRTKNYKLFFKVIIAGEALLLPACLLVGVFSYQICGWFFGEEYYSAGEVLRVMLPLIPIALVSYLMGFPALSPIGKASAANASVIAGAIFQVISILCLFASGSFSVLSVCWVTLATELLILAIRVVVLSKYFLGEH